MTMISIIPSEQILITQAEILALKWGFKLSDSSHDPYFFQLTPEHLQLVQSDKKSPGPIFVDFTAGQVAHRRQYGGGKGQTIAKAVGLNKSPPPLILDATAGMGKDAFIFASLGARVILMERSPISAALLSDGLQRAALDEEVAEIIARMSLICGDARLLLTGLSKQGLSKQGLSKHDFSNSDASNNDASNNDSSLTLEEIPDVIYLDPMFPHRKKSALVKKEMLAFQDLIGDDIDSNELLDICKQIAKKRVVVKRPIKAEWLDDQKPSLSMKMKKHRFDIYVRG